MCRLITGAGSVPAGPSVVCRERCIGVCFLCFRLMSVSVLDEFRPLGAFGVSGCVLSAAVCTFEEAFVNGRFAGCSFG